MVEGGRETLEAFISSGLWDEARIFTGNKWFEEGLLAPVIPDRPAAQVIFHEDILEICYNRKQLLS